MFLFATLPLAASAQEPKLIQFGATPADDDSVRVELRFDAPAPSYQIIHTMRNDVKIVLYGVERAPQLPVTFGGSGEVRSGSIRPFAHQGIVVELQLLNDVRPRVEVNGHELIVHIPGPSGDHEAEFALTGTRRTEGQVIIPLSFADASEIAGLIKAGAQVPSVDQFSATSPFAARTVPSTESGNGSAALGSTPSYVTLPTLALIPKDTAQGVVINDHVSIDRRLNAVILRGMPSEIAQYERLIKLVDTPRRTVLLETQIVELTETAQRDLGINFSPNGSLASATFQSKTGEIATGSLTLNARIQALSESGQAKILAQPRIVAVDNRMAAILSGEAVPIFTQVLVPSGGTTILQQQLQYINVGVSLEILPRIATNGLVTAQIFSEVSSIIDYVQTAPRIAVRQELTVVNVPDGQSALIGGLLQDQEIRTMGKIPGLGDIPLLGGLFKSANSTHQKTNLYIVITPHILTKLPSGAIPDH
ncbi:MAG: hypothetical protein M3N19_12200 [Candidatus Eremiobacteraeota bacterium]|nr:hypothetical protein [Candidatus Eremiobacteraeota bacterium]